MPRQGQKRSRLPAEIIDALAKVKELNLDIEDIHVSTDPTTTHKEQRSQDIVISLDHQGLTITDDVLAKAKEAIKNAIRKAVPKARSLYFRGLSVPTAVL
jgi:hypothetical protein